MSEDNAFADLIRRVRARDEAAAAELVRRYEPAIRRAVRVRLHDARLERVFESMDICQSVMASFFVRAALGQYELNHPEQLMKLLITMARNKLADQARRQQAERRDLRRAVALDPQRTDLPASAATASQRLMAQELVQQVQARLSAEERQLVELREQGREWTDIAAQLGGTPESRRKQLARAIDRVAQELGLDE